MKNRLIQSIIVFGLPLICLAQNGGFAELDGVVKSSMQMRIDEADAKRAWETEQARKNALLESLKASNAVAQNEIKQLENLSIEERKEADVLFKKICRDELLIEKISAFLDAQYSDIFKNKNFSKALNDCGIFKSDDFHKKNCTEKFRIVCELYKLIGTIDSTVKYDGDNISVGVNVHARGEKSGDVSILKVERNGGAK